MSFQSTGLSDDETRNGLTPLSVSVKDACRLLGIGPTLMGELIASQRVKTIKINRRRLVVYASLKSLLAAEPRVAS